MRQQGERGAPSDDEDPCRDAHPDECLAPRHPSVRAWAMMYAARHFIGDRCLERGCFVFGAMERPFLRYRWSRRCRLRFLRNWRPCCLRQGITWCCFVYGWKIGEGFLVLRVASGCKVVVHTPSPSSGSSSDEQVGVVLPSSHPAILLLGSQASKSPTQGALAHDHRVAARFITG
jgi:hypothetical protein